MWDLIVSVPDHCLSCLLFYMLCTVSQTTIATLYKNCEENVGVSLFRHKHGIELRKSCN